MVRSAAAARACSRRTRGCSAGRPRHGWPLVVCDDDFRRDVSATSASDTRRHVDRSSAGHFRERASSSACAPRTSFWRSSPSSRALLSRAPRSLPDSLSCWAPPHPRRSSSRPQHRTGAPRTPPRRRATHPASGARARRCPPRVTARRPPRDSLPRSSSASSERDVNRGTTRRRRGGGALLVYRDPVSTRATILPARATPTTVSNRGATEETPPRDLRALLLEPRDDAPQLLPEILSPPPLVARAKTSSYSDRSRSKSSRSAASRWRRVVATAPVDERARSRATRGGLNA